MDNLQTIQHLYAAFGRGDIPAIIEKLAPDVEWEYGITSTDVPWLQPQRGHTGAQKFFQALTALQFHAFNPHTLLANGDTVVALVNLEATVQKTGKRIVEEDEVHIWHFDKQGRVKRFRHRVDTAMHLQAFQG